MFRTLHHILILYAEVNNCIALTESDSVTVLTASNVVIYRIVLNSGHMVPMDVPRIALDMIKRFLSYHGYSSGNSMVGVALVNVEDAAKCHGVESESDTRQQPVFVKRGAGFYNSEASEVHSPRTNSSSWLRFSDGISVIVGFFSSSPHTSQRPGSSGGVCAAVILCVAAALGVFFFFRLQRYRKQSISRR